MRLSSHDTTWRSGRHWLYFEGRRLRCISLEWSLFKPQFGFGLHFSDCFEHELTLVVHIPLLLTFYLGFEFRAPKWFPRQKVISFDINNWSLHWKIWKDGDGWDSRTPRWRDGWFNIPDLFLGRAEYSSTEVERKKCKVCFPEGCYEVDIAIKEDCWSRTRFPRKTVMKRAHMDVLTAGGIPIPGKGENSWDCGDDATMGLTCPSSSIAEAIGELTESVLSTRLRRGGNKPEWNPCLT